MNEKETLTITLILSEFKFKYVHDKIGIKNFLYLDEVQPEVW